MGPAAARELAGCTLLQHCAPPVLHCVTVAGLERVRVSQRDGEDGGAHVGEAAARADAAMAKRAALGNIVKGRIEWRGWGDASVLIYGGGLNGRAECVRVRRGASGKRATVPDDGRGD